MLPPTPIVLPLPGLSDEEAARRRAAGQGNDVQISTGRSYGRIVRDNVFNFINNLFYVLGITLIALGKPLDAFVVVFVIIANTVISLVQEVRAKRVMDRITILMRPKAVVARAGRLQDVDPAQVVLGDILYVHAGDQVVVDGPMVGKGRMEIDESLLTGESDLVTKHPGDPLLSGSFCMTGGGFYEAQKVGLESFANKLTAKAAAFKRELTPLQRQVSEIVRVLLIVVVVFEILVWVRNTVGGVPFVESVRMSTVILALIPNGLVLSIALTYALGAVRLLGKDMLVQQFNAVESLSNVDVLCTDKTGTLTSGVIKFEDVVALGAEQERLARLLGAFSASTTDANHTIEALREAYPAPRLAPAHEALFSSSRKWSGLAFAAGEARGTYVLGAPEILAPALRAGAPWQSQADAWAARGLRVVLFAGRPEPVAFGDPERPPVLPEDLAPLGLVCFSDELRPGRAQDARRIHRGRHRGQDHLRRQPSHGERPRYPGRRARSTAPRWHARLLRGGSRRRPAHPGAGPGDGGDSASRRRRACPGTDSHRGGRRLRARSRRPLARRAGRRGATHHRLRPRHTREQARPGREPAPPRSLRSHGRRRCE